MAGQCGTPFLTNRSNNTGAWPPGFAYDLDTVLPSVLRTTFESRLLLRRCRSCPPRLAPGCPPEQRRPRSRVCLFLERGRGGSPPLSSLIWVGGGSPIILGSQQRPLRPELARDGWCPPCSLLGILNIITKSRLSFLILLTVPKMPNLSLMPLKPSCHP